MLVSMRCPRPHRIQTTTVPQEGMGHDHPHCRIVCTLSGGELIIHLQNVDPDEVLSPGDGKPHGD